MVWAGGQRPRNFWSRSVPTGAAACPRGARRVLDHRQLCSDNRGAHSLEQFLAGGVAKIEVARMLLAGAVLTAECLLTLTGKVSKCQASLTAVRAAAGLLRGSRGRHLKRECVTPRRQRLYPQFSP
jgi:hypothetical protein